jgi:hypothetical protein
MILDFFSPKPEKPPRGALCFFALATGPNELVAEEPLRIFGVNEQPHDKWTARVEFLVVDEQRCVGGRRFLAPVKRKVGYLQGSFYNTFKERAASLVQLDHALPGNLSSQRHYICEYVSGRISGGGTATFGY